MIKRFQFLAVLLLLAGCGGREPAKIDGPVERIISLAPGLTEIVYSLDLGDKLVGATTWCNYPEAARAVPRMGGFGQFNFEAMVAARPDLVIVHEQYAVEKARLDDLGIPYVETNTRSINEIRASIHAIGEACGAEERAQAVVARIDAARRAAQDKKRPDPLPRVLIVIGGEVVDPVYAIGMQSLHHEVLTLAGGENVVKNNLPNSILSREAIMRLNPEVIIQLAPGTSPDADPAAAWSELSSVEAVRNKRVYVLAGDHVSIPGPRVAQIIDDFTEIIESYE